MIFLNTKLTLNGNQESSLTWKRKRFTARAVSCPWRVLSVGYPMSWSSPLLLPLERTWDRTLDRTSDRTRGTPSPLKEPGTRDQRSRAPSPLWTDTRLWKQYLPHPSDAGGNKVIVHQSALKLRALEKYKPDTPPVAQDCSLFLSWRSNPLQPSWRKAYGTI